MSNPHGDMTLGDKSVLVQGQNKSSDMSQIKVLRIVDPGEGWKADCGMDTTRLVITASEVNLQYAKYSYSRSRLSLSTIASIVLCMFSAKLDNRRTTLPSYAVVVSSTLALPGVLIHRLIQLIYKSLDSQES